MREVIAAIARHAATTPDRIAIKDAAGGLTYRELLDRMSRTASWALTLPERVALVVPKSRQGITAHLALCWAGRTIVTLPEFFSPAQLTHVIRDSGAEVVVASHDTLEVARFAGWPAMVPSIGEPLALDAAKASRLVTYTSGTTGRPKGVVLGEAQVHASIRGMAEAVGAAREDRMLSVLPQALLLEQVAGMAVPLLVGASIVLCEDPRSLPVMAEAAAPTVTILVPEMLNGWVRWLESSGKRAPASLRFVAVGGAPVPPALAERGWSLGLPVYEGYGLSECCSVVAVNRPGRRVAGTVGPPLPGIGVTIQEDEIVVSGPTVMEGYLGGAATHGTHRTGDAGHLDADGNLVVSGRLDDVIVTSTGRNIHPAWIEALILGDSRIARCAVVGAGAYTRAVLCPGDERLLVAGQAAVDDMIARLCADAPDYARPRDSLVVSEARLSELGLIGPDGSLSRREIAARIKEIA